MPAAAPTGAYEANLTIQPGCVSGSDLTNYQYYFVKEDTNGFITTCTAQGEPPLGVLQDAPHAAGRSASVAVGGTTKMVAAAAIAKGAYVGTDATGRAITVAKSTTNTTAGADSTTDALVGGYAFGRAITAATAAGDIFTMRIVNAGAMDTTPA